MTNQDDEYLIERDVLKLYPNLLSVKELRRARKQGQIAFYPAKRKSYAYRKEDIQS